jgi:epoxyqueuosine reductase
LTPEEFGLRFRRTALWRTKRRGLLRNVAIAMGNAGEPRYAERLEELLRDADDEVSGAAEWALRQIKAGAK